MDDHRRDIGYLIKAINGCIGKNFDQDFKEAGVTLSQMRVLMYLRRRGEEPTCQKDIESYFEVSHPTIVGILQRLETKGFITTELADYDKRVKLVKPTEKAQEFYERMFNTKMEMEGKLLRGLSEDQVQSLKVILNIIYNNVK